MDLGRTLIIAGVVLIVVGLVVTFGDRLPMRLGHLPGDINYQGRNGSFHFPIVTCLILSVLLSITMWFFNRK